MKISENHRRNFIQVTYLLLFCVSINLIAFASFSWHSWPLMAIWTCLFVFISHFSYVFRPFHLWGEVTILSITLLAIVSFAFLFGAEFSYKMLSLIFVGLFGFSWFGLGVQESYRVLVAIIASVIDLALFFFLASSFVFELAVPQLLGTVLLVGIFVVALIDSFSSVDHSEHSSCLSRVEDYRYKTFREVLAVLSHDFAGIAHVMQFCMESIQEAGDNQDVGQYMDRLDKSIKKYVNYVDYIRDCERCSREAQVCACFDEFWPRVQLILKTRYKKKLEYFKISVDEKFDGLMLNIPLQSAVKIFVGCLSHFIEQIESVPDGSVYHCTLELDDSDPTSSLIFLKTDLKIDGRVPQNKCQSRLRALGENSEFNNLAVAQYELLRHRAKFEIMNVSGSQRITLGFSIL